MRQKGGTRFRATASKIGVNVFRISSSVKSCSEQSRVHGLLLSLRHIAYFSLKQYSYDIRKIQRKIDGLAEIPARQPWSSSRQSAAPCRSPPITSPCTNKKIRFEARCLRAHRWAGEGSRAHRWDRISLAASSCIRGWLLLWSGLIIGLVLILEISLQAGIILRIIALLHLTDLQSAQASYMHNIRGNSKKKNSEAGKPNSAVLYSAALQDHFLKKNNFNLLEPKFNSFKTIKNSEKLPPIGPAPREIPISRAQVQIKKLTEKQKHSILPFESETLKKMKEAKNDQQKMMKYNKQLTWAQKLGIVEKPPMPLTAKDWQAIEQKSKQRNDSQSICSICLEDFKIEPQVILSCSHVFHDKCLKSFERHNKAHCCPICRRQNYEKKLIDEALRLYTMKCILRLQRVYRGSRTRIRVYRGLVEQGYVAQSKLWNRRLIGFKMWRLSSKIKEKAKRDLQKFKAMVKRIEDRHKQETEGILEQMVQIQRQKIENQGVIEEYLNKMGIQRDERPDKKQHQHNWQEIIKKGADRAGPDEQCSICLMALWSKPVYMLSCTHTFHVNCVDSFERYGLPGCKNKCPCCRSQYDKKVVEKKK